MNAQPQTHLSSVPTVQSDVDRLLTLKDAKATIDTEIAAIRARLADQIGAGNSQEVGGVTVTVRPPNRRFNAARAAGLLDEATLDACKAVDPKLVKKHLTAIQVEECMDDGTGDPIVEVK